MANQKYPVALRIGSSIELIECVLKSNAVSTTMIICSLRESFLENLQHEILSRNPTNVAGSPNKHDKSGSNTFLIPSGHLLVTSKKVQLAFVPTLSHLKAYLAHFRPTRDYATAGSPSTGRRTPLLVIHGLIALHRSTRQHSAQGLSQTIAQAVEAANFADMKLVLAEPQYDVENERSAISDSLWSWPLHDPWEEQVPLLNHSVRLIDDETTGHGRTINVRRIITKWCRISDLEEEFLSG